MLYIYIYIYIYIYLWGCHRKGATGAMAILKFLNTNNFLNIAFDFFQFFMR